MQNKVLIVVDMQNDFIDGALGTQEAVEIIDGLCDKIRTWDGDLIVTQDTHRDDYLTTAEGKMLPIPHCIDGTHGHLLNAKIERAVSDFKFHCLKVQKDAFGSLLLANYLAQKDYAEVLLCGLCTDVCVISNAVLAKGALPNADVSVEADLCAGVTPASHLNALSAMAACGIRICKAK